MCRPATSSGYGTRAPSLPGGPSSISADATPSTSAARPAISSDLVLELPAGKQLSGQVGEQRRLPLTLLGRSSAPPRAGCELADHHRGREVDGEREPVLAVGRA